MANSASSKLYHGNRRITLAGAEALVPTLPLEFRPTSQYPVQFQPQFSGSVLYGLITNKSPSMKSINILVTGDVILDHHIYRGVRARMQDESEPGLHIVIETGGAALTERLVAKLIETQNGELATVWKNKVEQANKERQKAPEEPAERVVALTYDLFKKEGEKVVICEFPDHLKSYAEWEPSPGKDKETVWRVAQKLGYGADPAALCREGTKGFPKARLERSDVPDILVLDDAGAQFRHPSQKEHWHLPGGDTADASSRMLPPWIVLKLGGSVDKGALWQRLQETGALKRTVIVVPVEELRLMEVQLGPALSWEQTAGQIISEVNTNPVLKPLRECLHLVVSFGNSGAVWFDWENAHGPEAVLVFDPNHGEGEWRDRVKGEALGYNTCLAAAVVAEVALVLGTEAKPNLADALARGLSGMRRLRESGHGPTRIDQKPVLGAGFPVDSIAAEIGQPSQTFARALLPSVSGASARPDDTWTILASSQGMAAISRPFYGFARQFVLRGEKALKGVPHLSIGQLLTASRQEMESLRLLRRLMLGYKEAGQRNPKPLSIGVFGAPGAGKSFGVRELATGVFGDEGAKSYAGWMEFNLSQFKDSTDLIGAFHQVRDRVLQGFVPVVFWDEFDSGNYKWLQYLLAPMQDGKFQEGQITHPIGKCVFIFAGATASTFKGFGPKTGLEKDENDFKQAKGPDFKSRLDAYLNVLGPNRAEGEAAESDLFFPVRRAMLLRALLGCKEHERLEIDSGLLTALLSITKFEHGARSLEKLVEPLKAARQAGKPIRRSLLASVNQLALYVDPQVFYTLCQQDEAFKEEEVVRAIAPAVHAAWQEIARNEGWKMTFDKPYDQLPLEAKRSNEAAARRMPEILAMVGLCLEPGIATSEEEKQKVEAHLLFHRELLSEAEHEGWMEHLFSEGWSYSKDRDNGKRLHNCLVPYHQLREVDRDKDRKSIDHYPDFARTAKWKIRFA